jgi:DNA-binding transcriptional LysR family regulator
MQAALPTLPNVGHRDTALARLRLRDLALLLAIHEHRSITAAAARLGLTQPAVSRTLRDIEQILRVHVFERDRAKGMHLTAAGELVINRVRALIADCRSLTAELDAWRAGTGGHLRLGIIPFVSGPLIERLLAELTGERHRMSVSVREAPTTSLVEELRTERLDAVIGRCTVAPLPAGLAQEQLIRQEAWLVVPSRSPRAKGPRVKLATLDSLPWLLPPEGTPTRAAINDAFTAAKLAPPVPTVEAASIKIIHLALRANPRMASIVPSDAGEDLERFGDVRRLPFPLPLLMPPIGLITAARHRDTPVVRNLHSALREVIRKRRT